MTLEAYRRIRHEQMSNFLRSFTQADVDEALTATLLNPTRNNNYDRDTEQIIYNTLKTLSRESEPPVATIFALAREMLQIGNPKLWKFLLAKQKRNNYQLKKLLLQNPAVTSPAEGIASSNLLFMGDTITKYAIAITVGNEYPKYIDSSSKVIFFHNSENPRYTAGRMVAQTFGTPANTSQEILKRLQILFPLNPKTAQDIPAFQFVQQANAFKENFPHRIGSCIGINMTGMLFTAYGKLLNNSDYTSSLSEKIQISMTP